MASRYRGVIKIKNMKDKTISASLIFRKIEGKLSAVEEERFEAWLKEGWEHREYYERMRRMYQQENVQEVETGEIQEAWVVFEKRVQGQRRIERRQRWVWVMSAVASVVLVICCWSVYYRVNTGQKLNVAVQKILPGQYNAVLEMADGATYQLGEQQYFLQERTGNQIKVDSTVLSYLPVNNKSGLSQDIVYNKLSVPKGGEYRIELEDGTKVWINSASRLRYPVVFSGDTREVYLEGEGFFQVAKDAAKPFIVHCEKYAVRVLGTTFNISAYRNDEVSMTTLVEGRVNIECGNTVVALTPGLMAAVADSKVTTREVNVESYISWTRDQFSFSEERLEDLLKKISRWYDVEFVFDDEEIKDYKFSGFMPRYESIDAILQIMEQAANVTFKMNNKQIVVYTHQE